MSAASKSGELAGIVYGPHVRVPLTEYVRRATLAGAVVRQCLLPCVSTAFVATTVPFIAVPQVRQYPDITHTLSDQFPLPRLHPAWSLTHYTKYLKVPFKNPLLDLTITYIFLPCTMHYIRTCTCIINLHVHPKGNRPRGNRQHEHNCDEKSACWQSVHGQHDGHGHDGHGHDRHGAQGSRELTTVLRERMAITVQGERVVSGAQRPNDDAIRRCSSITGAGGPCRR